MREQSQKDLEVCIEAADPALRQALATTTSAEVRRRINLLLEKRQGVNVDFEEVRALRGVEVLERLADRDALALLEALAKGDEKQRLTREARAALQRLVQRRSP